MTRKSAAAQTTLLRLAVPVGEGDHMLGSATAPTTLVEYGDFECPYSGMVHLVVKELQQELGRQLRFVYRHFPMVSIHPHVEAAAEAAEAAGAQGKFWQMHDLLFAHQTALEEEDLVSYATVLHLHIPKFVAALESYAHMPRIREDLEGGVQGGVRGTPTFFINDVLYDGPYDYVTLLDAIESANQRQNARR
jgi:protein-disulfide isomerase